ncbi:hypothetical protein J7E83_05720 [Arthrobacter sp. ISL-48]|uniref:hypothetical protein n=1 Tax=Arthrobacter sp. ISL-48 TaxID=2819110 RepID=UPI001BEA1061|nr:hypothetical protein [Arthrobacter sp. ISL-48]MBT2531626.1 hypothetical protein [Arthrobacter sp. ISL-48]
MADVYNIVNEIVSKEIRKRDELPEDYREADAGTRRHVERMAEESGDTPENVWKTIRARHAQDKANGDGGFDAAAIAKASRQ